MNRILKVGFEYVARKDKIPILETSLGVVHKLRLQELVGRLSKNINFYKVERVNERDFFNIRVVHKLRWQVFFWHLPFFVDIFYIIKVGIFGLPTHLFL